MKTIKHFFTALLLVFAATSCIDGFVIEGNRIVNSEDRNTPAFTKVKSSGSFEVYIAAGETIEIVVEAEQTILPYIETTVSGNTLLIDIPGWNSVINHRPMKVFITMPVLESAKLSGSGLIETEAFENDEIEFFVSGSGSIVSEVTAEQVEAGISGSGKIIIEGFASNTKFNISGSGNIFAGDLSTENCRALISGSGSMRVLVHDNLHAEISGSGNVYYKGNPYIDYHVSGSGKVISEN